MVNNEGNYNQDKYVMLDGKLVPKSVVKEVKKGLMRGEQQEIQYELDDEKVLDLMLEFVRLTYLL